jgi:hypothetical protein
MAPTVCARMVGCHAGESCAGIAMWELPTFLSAVEPIGSISRRRYAVVVVGHTRDADGVRASMMRVIRDCQFRDLESVAAVQNVS